MAESGSPAGSSGAAAPDAHGAPGHAPVDVQRLADKVYALMLAEARLGHSRTELAAAPKRYVED